METTILGYILVIGLCRDNGRGNGSYYIRVYVRVI